MKKRDEESGRYEHIRDMKKFHVYPIIDQYELIETV